MKRDLQQMAIMKYDADQLTMAALCLWEAALEDRALMDRIKVITGEGAWAAREYVIDLAPLCEDVWAILDARADGDFPETFDWEYCPAFLDYVTRHGRYGAPEVDDIVRAMVSQFLANNK